MRHCSGCKVDKIESEFNKNSCRKDGLQTFCKECNREKSKTYYASNIEKHRKVVRQRNKMWTEELRSRVYGVKRQKGCLLCKEGDPCCLDFHHPNDDKKDNVATLVASGYSWQVVEEEINKCVILCANCHRKIHAGKLQIDGVVADWNAPAF